jgi:hypothetical protein
MWWWTALVWAKEAVHTDLEVVTIARCLTNMDIKERRADGVGWGLCGGRGRWVEGAEGSRGQEKSHTRTVRSREPLYAKAVVPA